MKKGSFLKKLMHFFRNHKNPKPLKIGQSVIAMEVKREVPGNNVDRAAMKSANKSKQVVAIDDDDVAVLQFISSGGTNSEAIKVLEERDMNLAIQLSLMENEFLYDHHHNDGDGGTSLPGNPTGSSSSREKREPVYFVCDICSEYKFSHESFNVMGCDHSFCADCVRSYVGSKLDIGVSQITCPVPNCNGVLDPEFCREILPLDLYIRWGKSLCEAVILGSQKFYCPFKDCSEMMIDDGVVAVTKSECLNCHRLFCAQCKVVWHEGIGCDEYQKLNEDERSKEDLVFRNLANNNKWKRCPACRAYVERTEGCNYIVCRCRVAFCYNCGAINNDHVHHRCPNCKLIWS